MTLSLRVVGRSGLLLLVGGLVSALDAQSVAQLHRTLNPQAIFSVSPLAVSRTTQRSVKEGVLMAKTNVLHQKGIKGKGVKIGLLDFGFTGYKALQATGAVPEPRAVKAFGKDQGWDRI